MKNLVPLLLASISISSLPPTEASNRTYHPELLYPWKQLDFTFETPSQRAKYTPENAMPCGVRVNSKKEYFITVPRFKANVPSSLNRVRVKDGTPLMEPFPSWLINGEGDISTNLQSVLGLEIDKNDILWALDQGHVDSAVALEGSIKVVAIDTMTRKVVDYYPMNSDIAPLNTSYLSDLAVDVDAQYIYIADSGIGIGGITGQINDPALIILNLKTKEYRRIFNNQSFLLPDPTLWINVNGERILSKTPITVGVDGLTLSCDGKILYFSALTSRYMYSIQTKYLQNFKLTETDILQQVVKLGYATSANEGLAATRNNNLLMTATERNGILMKRGISDRPEDFDYKEFELVCSHHKGMMWPNSIGFDNKARKMVFIANQAQNFFTGNMDFATPKYGNYNFRLWEVYMDDQSYVMGCESKSNYFPGWAIALIFVTSLFGFMILVCIYNCIIRRIHKKHAHGLLPSHHAKKISN